LTNAGVSPVVTVRIAFLCKICPFYCCYRQGEDHSQRESRDTRNECQIADRIYTFEWLAISGRTTFYGWIYNMLIFWNHWAASPGHSLVIGLKVWRNIIDIVVYGMDQQCW